MYCFSRICRICLANTPDLIKLNYLDSNNKTIYEKLYYCIPEIHQLCDNLPEEICVDCNRLIQRLYEFKQVCIDNTIKLNKYALKLSSASGVSNNKSRLIILLKFNLKTGVIIKEQDKENKIEHTPESIRNLVNILNSNISCKAVPKNDTSMYSVSLNQWDLFEKKYTCRCIKEFSSFTENTKHLCKNCEGELLGFRLSKIKVGVAEGRYNVNLAKIRPGDEEIVSAVSDSDTETDNTDESDDSDADEYGFDDDDLLLCKLHIKAVQKQIDRLEENINFYVDNPPGTYYFFDNDHDNELHKCPYCPKKFLKLDNFVQHKLTHHETVNSEAGSSSSSRGLQIDEGSETEEEEDEEEEEEEEEDQEQESANLNSSGEIQACGTCDKIFPSKGKLAIHLMTHVGQKEFKCPTCDKEFFRKENYDIHLKTHEITAPIDSNENNTECPLCNKTFPAFMNLRKHVKETHNVRRYMCIICDKLFNDKDLLNKHVDYDHSIYDEKLKILKYKCLYCDKNYFKAQNVRRHIRENHNITTGYCALCNSTFRDRRLYEEHVILEHSSDEKILIKPSRPVRPITPIVTTTDVPRYKCPCCERTYSLLQNVKRHLKAHHPHEKPEIYNIPVFGGDSMNNHDYEYNDMEVDTNEEMFKCIKCGKTFSKIATIRRHMLETHGINKYFCVYCNGMFDDRQTLNQHISRFHENHKNNIFDKTEVKVTNEVKEEPESEDEEEDEDEEEVEDEEDEDDDESEDEDYDMNNKKIEENERKHKCLYCEKRYFHKSNVRRHMIKFHSVDKYLCSICNKTFGEKSILEDHIFKTHTQTDNKTSSTNDEDKQKSYTCPVCKKNFNHLSNLRMHALSHAEMIHSEVDYTRCPICMKNISKRSSMSRHMETHNRGKIYDCMACSAKFDNRWVRAQHMRTQHPNFIPVYKCKYCPKTYNAKFTLGKHELTHTT